MAKNPNQKLKLLYLYQILMQKTDEQHKISMDELLAALSSCGIAAERKSVYSDIEALKAFGIDIMLQRGPGGGYYLASRDFELAELKLLVDAIQCSRFITEKKSNELIGKLEHLASDPQAHALQRQVYVSERVKTVNERIYYNIDTLHTAISDGVQITFLYFNWELDLSSENRIRKHFRKDGARYHISPWAMTWDNENYYLIAYDHESGKIKHYRVDKMEQIECTDQPREGRQLFADHFDTAAYARKVFGMFSGEERTVRLKCHNRFVGVILDRFGSSLMFQPADEEHFFINVTVAVSPQFFSWVFSLEGNVRIVEPADVREAFDKQLHQFIE